MVILDWCCSLGRAFSGLEIFSRYGIRSVMLDACMVRGAQTYQHNRCFREGKGSSGKGVI